MGREGGGLSIDDLEYRWPADVVNYETKYLMGFTMSELLIVALPALGVTMASGPLLGALAATLGFMLSRRFEPMGGHSMIGYLVARMLHARVRQDVFMPLILPRGSANLTVLSWDDEVLIKTVEKGDDL